MVFEQSNGARKRVVPKGTRVGHKDVRAAAGVTIATTNFGQIDDTGNHLHMDFEYAKGALLGRIPQ